MVLLIDSINAIRDFLDTGGQVLLVIGVLIFAMWLLILERFIYFFKGFRSYKQNVKAQWKNRAERNSWNAEQIRQAMISRASMRLDTNLALINVMVALCPLLGLLGTVTGMIEVFDVMAITGTGSARSMASGVSKATIPTMAGMVGALSGVFASTFLQRRAKREVELLEDSMVLDH
ncbi:MULTISPECIES: MotA/TolQ/ExbB proton channel family protein [Pseudoalteromonas]|jgi:biopolymer transport protein ExbB|uniref:Biopolymer transporter ExbB n=3 Tax=Pseudoalteromonas TaxID=53246 RepID=A0AAD0U4T2_9GAMM|nr:MULTISPECIES: MotA/TolQ/ExbB proton channel family protein [Pseudoalteromonas]MAJ40687.1 MotA/TolQ/ExbB proton channel family protein [Pseudoalteromonadaceae bacterium]MCP4057656.1 MotA/TolQ/ExbB proton channel family protein [Pseudoalteromonas sp.]MDC9522503.1 MotA/TolQ/ExbB proton channel family protein [Pseudoalteromonas sp. Angola-31]MDY6887623.1 MotA/TolQ/ExbB proton channel family protein [Pseudomonadota bacterium]OUX86314.1 MAG: biopolymer transporter ExbB [Pseudoalteromonas sp. TMED|tara:strand:- start:219 stop:746 length:528 start_codon:yes stop_codon:yes gene_type:complete